MMWWGYFAVPGIVYEYVYAKTTRKRELKRKRTSKRFGLIPDPGRNEVKEVDRGAYFTLDLYLVGKHRDLGV